MKNNNNRVFNTGAKRDTNKNKGRMDLIPFSSIYDLDCFVEDKVLFQNIAHFQEYKDKKYIKNILNEYMKLEDLISVSKVFQAGAMKYGENNWKKGIPENSLIDSAIRHFVKHRLGHDDEPHFHMFLWNMIALLWELENKDL